MSYPDLGCFAECLKCELCDDAPEDELDLNLDWDDYDRLFGDDLGWDDWVPPEPDEGGNWWDDWDLPDLYPTFEPTDGGGIFGAGGRF